METHATYIYTRSFKRLTLTKGKNNLHSHQKNLEDTIFLIINDDNNDNNS